jgi:Xaa-Pro aminopeptidase
MSSTTRLCESVKEWLPASRRKSGGGASRLGRLRLTGMRTLRRSIAALVLLVLSAAHGRASDFTDDLAGRRARVLDRIGHDAVLILWSAPTRTYSLDIDYEYRQDSNLYYLTGITEEETILVLTPGNPTAREVLFIKDKDPAREHWSGRLLSHTDATAASGIAAVMSTREFEPFVTGLLGNGSIGRLTVLLNPGNAPEPATSAVDFARRMHDRFPSVQAVDATPMFADLRAVKTPYEQKLLTKSLQISNDAHLIGMRATRPGAFEYEVKAAIEGAYRGRGAMSWAYPSIVGSGPNATILHYPEDDRQMKSGDLLLVDAAANYQYMSGDITRTYPVNGRFTQPQRELYALVLGAQDEAVKVAKPGSSLAAIHNKAVEVIKAGLLKLGLITDAKGDQYKMWFTHGATHYIGIDVHDVGDRNRPLEAGMAFVIEPGLYIRQSALDALPKTPENAALIQQIQPAVNTHLDLGVRVEDSFLLEPAGLRRLSASVPRTIDEIEAFMSKR